MATFSSSTFSRPPSPVLGALAWDALGPRDNGRCRKCLDGFEKCSPLLSRLLAYHGAYQETQLYDHLALLSPLKSRKGQLAALIQVNVGELDEQRPM
jgi:hypothetical protein